MGLLDAPPRPNPLGDRVRRAAVKAARRNSIDLGVMATPPAVTTGTATLDASLTIAVQAVINAGDIPKFRVTGGVPAVYATNYRTVWSASTQSGTGGNTAGDATHQTYQFAIEFFSDAPRLQLRVFSGINYMVEVDDQPISPTLLSSGTGGGTKFVLLDFTSAGGAKIRKYRLELAQGTGLYAVDIPPTYGVWAPVDENNLRTCVVGDSIVAATGATFPNGCWTKVAGKLLGWTDVREVAFGGTGFVNQGTQNTFGSTKRVADVVTHAPDLLVLQGSGNDTNSSGIQAAALAAYQAYRAALPRVPIICTGAHAASSGPSAGLYAVEDALAAAFTQWADPNSFYLPISRSTSGPWESGTGNAGATTGTGNRDRYGSDAAHPNDAGHLYYGRRFAEVYRSNVLPFIR